MQVYSDIPLPDPKRSRRYNFNELAVGQMAFFPSAAEDSPKANTLRQTARNSGKRHNMRFAVREIELDGVPGAGVWRIE